MAQLTPASTALSYQMSRDYTAMFFDKFKHFQPFWSRVAKMSSSDGNYENEAEISPLPVAEEIDQGAPVPFATPEEGNVKKWYHTKYGKGFQITEEAFDDDKYGHLKGMSGKLADSLNWRLELTFWDMFNNGFDSSYHTTGEGSAIFDQTNALLNSATTWSNEPSTAAALSPTTYEAALEYFDNGIYDEVGNYIPGFPYLLIICPSDKWMARKILKTELMPFTADNEINPYIVDDNAGMKYMSVPYLTSTTAFFVLAKDHDFRQVWRKKVQFKSGDDFNTGNALFKSTGRWSNVCVCSKMAYGNPGA